MKRFAAILSVVLLAWAQFAPAPATAACAKPAINCTDACRQMPCCAAKPSSDSQRAPAIPAQTGAQNQISLLAPSIVVWTLPENSVSPASSIFASPLLAMSAPLYARNCSLLL